MYEQVGLTSTTVIILHKTPIIKLRKHHDTVHAHELRAIVLFLLAFI